VNPENPRNLVAAWIQDVDSPFASAGGVAVSEDGGRSWRRGSLPGGSACAGGEAQFKYLADPWVAFGPDQVAWVATLPFTDANPGAVVVNRSTDGGRSFSGARFVDRDLTAMDFDDNETIAADPRNPKRAYVAWLKQEKTPPPVTVPLSSATYFSRTVDGGRTWSAPRALATTGTGTSLAGGVVAVRPNGDVLVAYPLIVPDNPLDCVTDDECAGMVTVYAVRSTNAGRTWSAPVVAARYRRGPILDPEGEDFSAPADIFSLTFDPRGVAYLAAHDESESPNSHIIVTRSRDGGKTWTGLTNAGHGSQAGGFKGQPTIAAGRHSLGIVYFDFRDDTSPGDGMAQYSWWFAHSDDGGRSWREQRLSRPSDLHAVPTAAIGQYFDLQPVGRDFAAAITVATPLARRGPTDIAFVRLCAERRKGSGKQTSCGSRHRSRESEEP
jgi:hypothetical protein